MVAERGEDDIRQWQCIEHDVDVDTCQRCWVISVAAAETLPEVYWKGQYYLQKDHISFTPLVPGTAT